MAENKRNVWMPIIFSLILILGMFIGFELRDKTGYGSIFAKPSSSSVAEVLKLIESRYVDKVPVDSISTNVINQLLASLDPHSSFIPAEELTDVNDEIMGNFQGIGIEYQIINDSLNVMNLLPDGPAKKSGILVGDIFIKANDSILLTGKTIKPDDIRKYLRGVTGSTINITLFRNGQLVKVPILRSVISIPSVDAAYLADPQTGYIHINKFTERTHLEFMKSLDSLQKLHMKKLVLDLRGNGGGLMNEATKIADEFLSGEKLIVYTEGLHSKRINYTCQKDGMFEDGKLIVLVDETSASASEVLTGALQDWDRATIVGRRTYGKGLVQQQFMLSDGSAVRLTTAKYFTPLGRNIQKPYNKDKAQYKEEIYTRYHSPNPSQNYDSTKHNSKTYKTPAGHIVYGGGGITPDYSIPLDTNIYHSFYARLLEKDNLNVIAYKWYLQNKKTISPVKNIASLITVISNNSTWWNSLVEFSKKGGIDISKATDKDKKMVENYLQSFIARIELNKSAAAQISNQQDDTILKAMELLK